MSDEPHLSRQRMQESNWRSGGLSRKADQYQPETWRWWQGLYRTYHILNCNCYVFTYTLFIPPHPPPHF